MAGGAVAGLGPPPSDARTREQAPLLLGTMDFHTTCGTAALGCVVCATAAPGCVVGLLPVLTGGDACATKSHRCIRPAEVHSRQEPAGTSSLQTQVVTGEGFIDFCMGDATAPSMAQSCGTAALGCVSTRQRSFTPFHPACSFSLYPNYDNTPLECAAIFSGNHHRKWFPDRLRRYADVQVSIDHAHMG